MANMDLTGATQPRLFEQLVEKRDRQRHQREQGRRIIKQDELPTELTPHGYLRWYLHPGIEDVVVRSEIVYQQVIPPGSRSGKQHHPGGVLFYFWKGSGHTVLDGTEYRWTAGELLQLPHKIEGCTFQHYNDDLENEAVLIVTECNYSDSLGVDRGSVWEQLEFAPEYASRHGETPARA